MTILTDDITRIDPLTEDVDELKDLLREQWPPMVAQARREGIVSLEGDDDDDGDDDDSGEDDAAADADASGDDDDDGGDDDAGDDDAGTDDSAEVKAAKAAQAAAEKRLAGERKARKQAERKLAQRTQREREEAGEWEQVAKSKDEEIETLKAELRNGALDRSLHAVATRLKFRDPDLVRKLVSDDLRENAVDDDHEVDERAIERELKALGKKSPFLLEPERDRQSDVNGDQDRGRDNADEKYEFDPRGLEAAIPEPDRERAGLR